MTYALCNIDYRIEAKEPVIYLFCRDEALTRKVFKVNGHKPYYYYRDVFGEYPVQGIDGAFVTKKEVRVPSDVGIERDKHQFTYESDILYPIRFMVDRGIRYGLDVKSGEVQPAEFVGNAVLPLFLDVETEVTDVNVFPDPRKADWMLLAVTIWCPIDGNIAMWRFEISNEEEEEAFLKTFVKLIQGLDPDIITAYNVFFDMATILGRMKKHKIPWSDLSPLGYVAISDKYDEVKMAGRSVFDYLEAYKKYKHKILPSYKLEDISLSECGIPKSDYPMERMNRNHIDEIADYNILDVYRMMALEQKLTIIEFYDNIRRLVGCTFAESHQASKYVDVLLLRYCKDKYLLPRNIRGKKKQGYVGAIVLPPEKGVHDNVVFLDFSRMYPSIIISYNISPETLRLTKPEEPHYTLPVGFKYKDEDGKPQVRWFDVYYLKDPEGILPSVALDLIALRVEVQERMLVQPRGSAEYTLLWHRQDALKVVLDAMYGVFAYVNYRLYIPHISAAITGQGQKIMMRTMEYVETLGYTASYGDTDGLYFPVGKDVKPIPIGEELRDKVNAFWEVEKDKYGLYIAPNVKLEYVFEWLLLARKKRYAAMVIYDNGEETRELKIVGFEPRRSDSASVSQELQRAIFHLVDKRTPTNGIVEYAQRIHDAVKDRPLKEIGIPRPLKTGISERKNVAQVKSIVYANKYLNQKIGTGSRSLEYYIKPKRLKGQERKDFGFKDKPILPWGMPLKFELRTWSPKAKDFVVSEYIADRIAFNGVPDEKWRPFINMDLMAEKIVWNKVDTIFNALGLSEEDRIELYGSKRPIKKEADD